MEHSRGSTLSYRLFAAQNNEGGDREANQVEYHHDDENSLEPDQRHHESTCHEREQTPDRLVPGIGTTRPATRSAAQIPIERASR